jgi:cystathionine beta-lyase
VNALAFAAAIAAYRDGSAWLEALLDYLRRNRDLVTHTVDKMPGLSMTHVEATYLAWIDARGTGLERPAAFFEQAGVGLADGADFRGPGFLRLTFGCPRSTLVQALSLMQQAVELHGERWR